MIMTFLGGIWGKFATVIVGAVAVLSMLLRVRYKIRKGAKDEMRAEIQERTIERIREADEADRSIDGLDRDSIIDRLREQGHLRE